MCASRRNGVGGGAVGVAIPRLNGDRCRATFLRLAGLLIPPEDKGQVNKDLSNDLELIHQPEIVEIRRGLARE